jgi:hypothetical protein
MKLKIGPLGFACGVVLGASLLLVALVSQCCEGFGSGFLTAFASIYPWFDGTGAIGDSLIGALFGFVDGWIGGALIAWLYNFCSSKCHKE